MELCVDWMIKGLSGSPTMDRMTHGLVIAMLLRDR